MPQQITDYLRGAKGLTDAQRADLWDAFYQATDQASLTSALKAVDAPRGIKAELWDMKGVRDPRQDMSDPVIQERIRKHRAILEREAPDSAREQAMRQPQGAGGGYTTNTGAPVSAAHEAGIKEGAETLSKTAALMAGAPGASRMLGRLPGVLGKGGRFIATPTGAGAIAGAEELYRSGSPTRAIGKGVAVGTGLKVGGGVLGALGKRLLGRVAPAAAETGGATAAARGAVPRAAPAASGIPSRMGPVPSGSGLPSRMRPAPGPLPSRMQPGAPQAPAGGGVRPLPQGLPGRMQPGAAPPPAVTPPQPSPPPTLTQMGAARTPRAKVVGGSASSGGATTTPSAKPQTPIGQARSAGPMVTPRATTPTDEEVMLRLSSRLQGAPRELQQAAQKVMNARLDGTLSLRTPSGAPSQFAHTLHEQMGAQYGLTSPSKAQRFINMVLEAAGG